MPVATRGLNHLALAVRDPERAFRFYREVFGVEESWRGADSIEAHGPGRHDYLVFEKAPAQAGRKGGVQHFGFVLVDPAAIRRAEAVIKKAGGTIVERGEFQPGEPYVFFRDPDNYLVEIWHQTPPRAGTPRPRRSE